MLSIDEFMMIIWVYLCVYYWYKEYKNEWFKLSNVCIEIVVNE